MGDEAVGEMDRSGRGRRTDWVATRERVLDAAAGCFGEGGPGAVSMSGVAERAGVNRTTVHRHFATRDALLWAVSDRLVAGMGVELDAELGAESLAEGIDGIVRHFVEHPDEARRTLRGLCRAQPTPAARRQLDHEVAMMQLLAGGPLGRAGIDAEVLGILQLAGMLLWSSLSAAGVVEGGPSRYRAEVLRLMLHGAIEPTAVPRLEAARGQ